MIKSAEYCEQLENNVVVCHLCPAECRLTEGKAGICVCRYNQGGKLLTDNYGEIVTVAVDPIEKKPLYHYHPGSLILSVGPNCCNLGCLHCQNWTISQEKTRTMYMSPEALLHTAVAHHSIGVAFTYTEPTMWFEYLLDAAPLLRANGLKVVLVTNGYLQPEPLQQLISITDAMNIDIKGMREQFYRRICKGKLQPVLDNIRMVAASGVHLELTNLIIPEENDSDQDLAALVDFVASVSDTIPLHFSAYHPDFKLTREATPAKTLLRARELAEGKLKYVYLGNVDLPGASDTRCPQCSNLLISRSGYRAKLSGLQDGRCSRCQAEAGIRMEPMDTLKGLPRNYR